MPGSNSDERKPFRRKESRSSSSIRRRADAVAERLATTPINQAYAMVQSGVHSMARRHQLHYESITRTVARTPVSDVGRTFGDLAAPSMMMRTVVASVVAIGIDLALQKIACPRLLRAEIIWTIGFFVPVTFLVAYADVLRLRRAGHSLLALREYRLRLRLGNASILAFFVTALGVLATSLIAPGALAA